MCAFASPSKTDLEFINSSAEFITEKLHNLKETLLALEAEINDLDSIITNGEEPTELIGFKKKIFSNLMDAKYKVLIYATACDMLLSYKKEIPAYLASIFALTPTSSSFKINFSPILDAMLIYFQTEKKRIEADLKIISTGLELAASVRDYIDTTKTKLSYEVEE